jgi:hypothetical protein
MRIEVTIDLDQDGKKCESVWEQAGRYCVKSSASSVFPRSDSTDAHASAPKSASGASNARAKLRAVWRGACVCSASGVTRGPTASARSYLPPAASLYSNSHRGCDARKGPV